MENSNGPVPWFIRDAELTVQAMVAVRKETPHSVVGQYDQAKSALERPNIKSALSSVIKTIGRQPSLLKHDKTGEPLVPEYTAEVVVHAAAQMIEFENLMINRQFMDAVKTKKRELGQTNQQLTS